MKVYKNFVSFAFSPSLHASVQRTFGKKGVKMSYMYNSPSWQESSVPAVGRAVRVVVKDLLLDEEG